MTAKGRVTEPPIALTIAGLDPSGGAGIIADIRTFAAFGCFGAAAVTSLTFQNTIGVFGAVHQTPATVRGQVMPIIEDVQVSCAKTGMLPTREIIAEVAQLFRLSLPAPVVDPVMRATSGDDLIDDDAVSCLVADLFPLARLVTPNIPEAERLTGLRITDESGMREAASQIRRMGARAVLVKGGHLGRRQGQEAGAGGRGRRQEAGAGVRRQESGGRRQEQDGGVGGRRVAEKPNSNLIEAVDILDDDGKVIDFRGEMITGREMHGSGCTLSAAIAAGLGHGVSLTEAIQKAKHFVTEAIKFSPRIGQGAWPLYLPPSRI